LFAPCIANKETLIWTPDTFEQCALFPQKQLTAVNLDLRNSQLEFLCLNSYPTIFFAGGAFLFEINDLAH
jgi:hypothetical protein